MVTREWCALDYFEHEVAAGNVAYINNAFVCGAVVCCALHGDLVVGLEGKLADEDVVLLGAGEASDVYF